jgi:signal peptidase I
VSRTPNHGPDIDDPDLDGDDDDLTMGQAIGAWFSDMGRTWGPALLVVLIIRSVFAEPFRIPSGSMVPTLAIGDHILVTKSSYGLRIPLTRIPITELSVPERGDVVVFVFPGSDEDSVSHWLDLPFPPVATLDYVKRVVGLPGDMIEVKDNTIHINGTPLKKEDPASFDFVDDRCRTYGTERYTESMEDRHYSVLNAARYGMRVGDYGPQLVPEGHVFAMGDNRDHSADSRVWGFVPLRNIKGKAQFVWLSYDVCRQGESGSIPGFGKFRGSRFGTPI